MLKKYFPCEYAESVFLIDYEKLLQKGFKGIIFDIDNTLVHHGDDSTPEIDALFKEIHSLGLKTVLLTNNDEERVLRFIRNIDTPFVCDADKPEKKGYLKALEILGIDKDEAVVIGDQIFTDIYGANQCAIPSILVKFITLPGETKIGKRRYIEKAILSIRKLGKNGGSKIGGIERKKTNALEKR
ncbi:MAG: HAD-IIIA family hydrolase [Clostridia bacterium]|nr:HAD-IIIA family hydrolase [Clostridia bacterium]